MYIAGAFSCFCEWTVRGFWLLKS